MYWEQHKPSKVSSMFTSSQEEEVRPVRAVLRNLTTYDVGIFPSVASLDF